MTHTWTAALTVKHLQGNFVGQWTPCLQELEAI